MPLPRNLVGLRASSNAYFSSLKNNVEGYRHSHSAQDANSEARSMYEKAESNLKAAREQASFQMKELGELKLRVWSVQLGRFAELFGRLKDVEFTGTPDASELQEFQQTIPQMKDFSLEIGQAMRGGAAAAGAGAIIGVSSYLGVAAWGTASTSTAIGVLSGAAATNATLAWFGGGSLAAGGLGITGGICILGGIVAIPVLVVGSVELYAHEKKKLANAKTNLEKARFAAAQMNTAATMCDGISRVAQQFRDAIESLRKRLDKLLVRFEELLDFEEELIGSHGGGELISYKDLDTEVQERIHNIVQAVQVMKMLLETPILNKDGALCKDSQMALDKADEFEQVAA